MRPLFGRMLSEQKNPKACAYVRTRLDYYSIICLWFGWASGRLAFERRIWDHKRTCCRRRSAHNQSQLGVFMQYKWLYVLQTLLMRCCKSYSPETTLQERSRRLCNLCQGQSVSRRVVCIRYNGLEWGRCGCRGYVRLVPWSGLFGVDFLVLVIKKRS